MRAPFEIAGETIGAGKRRIVDIPLGLMSDHTPASLSVQVIHGRQDGPTMFVSAANLMANILGAEDYQYVTIEHPISSADPQKLMAWAKKAAHESAQILSGQRA